MKTLTRDDPLYVQLQAELDAWYRSRSTASPLGRATAPPWAGDRTAPSAERPIPSPLALFAYRRRNGEDLFSLNARLNLPYDTLVTLNAAASRAEFDSLTHVLVPTRPGLFVSDPPTTALEDMMLSSRVARGLTHERIVVQRGGRKAGLWFFPGELFNRGGTRRTSCRSSTTSPSCAGRSPRATAAGRIPLRATPPSTTALTSAPRKAPRCMPRGTAASPRSARAPSSAPTSSSRTPAGGRPSTVTCRPWR